MVQIINRRTLAAALKAAFAFGSLAALPACSTIIEGTTQEIAANTNPSAATCGFYRQGTKIAEVQSTPGSALIKKTKYDMTVLCLKDGYQQATYLNHSGTAGATIGNIILGGGIGWAVDSATGSDNKYDSPMNVTLVPVDAKPPLVESAAPAPQLPAVLPIPGAPPPNVAPVS